MQTLMKLILGIGVGLWLRDILRGPRTGSTRRVIPSRDNLRLITGIGPVFESALHDIGIHTFSQLAHEDADQLSERLGAVVSAERIRREGWIEQAKELSRS